MVLENFSVNYQMIFLEFYKGYFLVEAPQRWEFHEIIFSVSKFRPFDM